MTELRPDAVPAPLSAVLPAAGDPARPETLDPAAATGESLLRPRPEVRLSTHAIDRGRKRVPDLGQGPMMTEVADALEAGRRAKTWPRWAYHRGRRKVGKTGQKIGERIVWNEAETRCYLVTRVRIRRDDGTVPGWLVLTVVSRDMTDSAAAAGSV